MKKQLKKQVMAALAMASVFGLAGGGAITSSRA